MQVQLINKKFSILGRIFLFLIISCALNANEILLKGVWKFEQYEKSNIHEPYDLLNLKFELTKDYKIKGEFEYFFRWFSKVEDLKEFNSTLDNNVFYFPFDSNFGGKNGKIKISINDDCSLNWKLIKEPDGEYYAPLKAYLNVVQIDVNNQICNYHKLISISSIEKKIKTKKDLKTYNKEFFQNLLPEKPIEKKTLTTYNNIAYYLQKAGSNKEAIYLLEKIIEKFPKRTVAYYNLGDAYWALGEKEKAKKAYSTYIKMMKEKGKEKKIPKKLKQRVKNKETFFTMLLAINPANRIDVEDFKNNPDGYNKFLLMNNKLYLRANMRLDHRIFGFSKPSYDSKLMILFSIYTDDVKNNPYKCSLGAYYDTTSFDIVYLKTVGDFIKTKIKHLNQENIVYFEKKWVKK